MRRCIRRSFNLDLLEKAINLLRIPQRLPVEYNDHPLRGNYKKYRECHLDGDWVLIYKIEGDELHLVRTGSHSDLFKGY